MLKIGIQTKGILEGGILERGISAISEAGFSCVDFDLDTFLSSKEVEMGSPNSFFTKSEPELKKYFSKCKELMRRYYIMPSQLQAPHPVFVAGRDDVTRYMMNTVIPKCFCIAEYLEIPYLVIHPLKLQYVSGKAVEEKKNLDYFKSLIPLIKSYGVMVCIENLQEARDGGIEEGAAADPRVMVRWIKELNREAGAELFGACLNTGNMNLVHRAPYDTIVTLGKHLKVLRLNDNDGIHDLRQLPYSFSGKDGEGVGVLWDELIQGLREVEYKGVLNFETGSCMKSFPEGVKGQVLKTICRTGEHLGKEIEK